MRRDRRELLPYLALYGAMWMLGLLLASCGPAHADPKPLPPNTEQVCTRAVDCGAVPEENWPQCLACIESVAEQWNERAAELFPDKTIDDLTCDVLVPFAEQTNLTKCSMEGWFGP